MPTVMREQPCDMAMKNRARFQMFWIFPGYHAMRCCEWSELMT